MAQSVYPSLLNISLDRVPTLTRDNWEEWNGVLCSILAPYEGALEIMTGDYQFEAPGYCLQLDKELQSIIHRLVSSEYRVIVRDTITHCGHLGSEVYEELLFQQQDLLAQFRNQGVQLYFPFTRQGKGESLEDYKVRFLVVLGRCGILGNYFDSAKECFIEGLWPRYRFCARDSVDTILDLIAESNYDPAASLLHWSTFLAGLEEMCEH
jgi:hypothetical protein